MLKIFKKKRILAEILFIFLLSLTPLLWFRPGEMMVGHDNVFPLAPKAFLEGRLYTWTEKQGFGEDQSLILGTIPIHLIDALPNILGFSLINTQKIVYVFWFFLIGLSVYILASLINPQSRFFKLFVTVFYQFNFFILQGWWIGERTKFSAYIAMPLIISVFLLVYRQKIGILKAAVLNSLTLFFFNAGGLFGIPLYGGLFISVGLFIIFFSLMAFFQKEYGIFKNLILTTILTFIGFLLVNLYYLLPAFNQFFGQYGPQLGGIGGVAGVLAWAQEISVGASFTNLFRLQGIAEWYDNPQHPYAKYFLTNPILISISFIFPLLVFSSLVLVKEKEKAKFVLYFFLVYLVGIFFAAGTHPPLGFIYGVLVRFIPGFAIFRTPFYKFASALFFSNAFLCAFSLDALREKIAKFKICQLIFCLFWFILILGYHFPYFTGEFFNWRDNFSTRVKVPQYVFNFGEWLGKEKKDDYRILLLPPNSPEWQYDIYKWGYLSLEPLGWLFSRQPLLVNSNTLNREEQLLLSAAYNTLFAGEKELFGRLAFLLRIKYLLVRKDFFYDLKWAKTESPFLYQETIRQFNYPLKKAFGAWEVYEVDTVLPEKLFVFRTPDILDIPQENMEEYFGLVPKNERQFIFIDEKDHKPFLKEDGNSFIIPQCLNCRHEKKPVIDFPERKVLPDSIIYPLVLLNEKIQLKKTSLKSAIYDDIGLSLKRAGEIREVVLQRKTLKSEYLDRYLEILQRISREYDQIQEFEEKFQVAEDLNYYLTAQQKYFQTLLGTRISYGKELKEIKRVFLAINSLQEKIDPFIFKKEQSNNRLYSFNVNAPHTFKLLLKKESIQAVIGEKVELEVILDNNPPKRIELKPEELGNEFISLGEITIREGKHRLLFSLPPLPNLTDEFIFSEGDFWGKAAKCFTSKIRRFDNRKVYKIDLSYKNDFSDDFLMIIRKKGANGEILESILKFPYGHEENEFQELIYSLEDIKEASIGFCAPELSRELLEGKVNLRVIEVVHPLFVFASKETQETEITPISFEKINPTKYHLKIRDAKNPFVLAFLERFDDSWKLSGFEKNHFELNGYANGWWVDKKGDHDLILEHSPQRLFYLGTLISGLVVVLSLWKIKKS